MSQQLVLSQPLSADRAAALGLTPREYVVGEQISIPDTFADRLQRAGYALPVGATPTVVYGGMDPSIPAFIRMVSGTYPLRTSVTQDATRPVIWIGTTSSAIGGGYAVASVDVWIQA